MAFRAGWFSAQNYFTVLVGYDRTGLLYPCEDMQRVVCGVVVMTAGCAKMRTSRAVH